jgi:membrane associated rhomboid family serine protease
VNKKQLCTIRKAVASFVTAALLITAPGLPCYQAAAAQINLKGNIGAVKPIGTTGLSVSAITGTQLNMGLSNQMTSDLTGLDLTGTSLKIQNPAVVAETIGDSMISRALLDSSVEAPVNDEAVQGKTVSNPTSKSLIKNVAKTTVRFFGKKEKKGAPAINFDGSGIKSSLVFTDEAVDASGFKAASFKTETLSQPTASRELGLNSRFGHVNRLLSDRLLRPLRMPVAADLKQADSKLKSFMRHVPFVTLALCSLNVAVYGAETHFPEVQQWTGPWRFHANQLISACAHFNLLSMMREIASIFTAMFLHVSADHLWGNMQILGIIGTLVETTVGAWRTLRAYLITGVVGELFFMLTYFGTQGACGASAAIAGLMGFTIPCTIAYFWEGHKYKSDFVPSDVAVAAAKLIFLIFGAAVFAMLGIDQISSAIKNVGILHVPIAYTSHVGGLLAGVALGTYWGLKRKLLRKFQQ